MRLGEVPIDLHTLFLPLWGAYYVREPRSTYVKQMWSTCDQNWKGLTIKCRTASEKEMTGGSKAVRYMKKVGHNQILQQWAGLRRKKVGAGEKGIWAEWWAAQVTGARMLMRFRSACSRWGVSSSDLKLRNHLSLFHPTGNAVRVPGMGQFLSQETRDIKRVQNPGRRKF